MLSKKESKAKLYNLKSFIDGKIIEVDSDLTDGISALDAIAAVVAKVTKDAQNLADQPEV